MRHVIADAIGAPAERQLGKVAGADHQAAILVGEPEQIVRAQPGLDVLEGDVVDRLAARKRMAEIALASACAAGRMSISAPVTPSARISAQALLFVCSEVAKPGSV